MRAGLPTLSLGHVTWKGEGAEIYKYGPKPTILSVM